MNLNTIYNDPIFLAERHVISTKKILTESCEGLTAVQKRVVEGIYNEFIPLIKHTIVLEQTLTADQVKQLFANIEQGATDAGGNRTLLGKGVDFTKKADTVINRVGEWMQNTAPVKAFDQKFDTLKASVSEKFPNIAKQLTALGDLARENPGKTAAIIGVMTSIASFAGTPAAGAAVGYALRGAVELLKGEKLSTAIGKGLKTAAYGWLAGKAFELIGDVISGGVKAITSPFSPKLYQLDLTKIAEGTGMPFSYESVSAFGKPEDIDKLQNIFNQASKAFDAGNYAAADAGFQQAAQLNDYMNSMDYFLDAGISDIMNQQQTIAQIQKGASELMRGLASAAQGAAAGATAYDKSGKPVDDKGKPVTGEQPSANSNQRVEPTMATPREALIYQLRPLTESQVYLVFNRMAARNDSMLIEGKLMEKDDPVAPKQGFMQKVMGKVGEFGKNMTTKVTASKLASDWKSAGSPTDSDELAGFFAKQGINDQVVAGVYKTMRLPAPGTAGKERDMIDIKKEITKMGTETQKQMLTFLNQKLGTA